MSLQRKKQESESFNIGHRKRAAIIADWEWWRCGCSWCGFSSGFKYKTARIKKYGKIKRIKPPWKIYGKHRHMTNNP